MELKYRLIAEVLRQWKQDAEERALGEFVLFVMNWDLADIARMTVPEIIDEIKKYEKDKNEKEATQDDGVRDGFDEKENDEEVLIPEPEVQIVRKTRATRK